MTESNIDLASLLSDLRELAHGLTEAPESQQTVAHTQMVTAHALLIVAGCLEQLGAVSGGNDKTSKKIGRKSRLDSGSLLDK